MPVVCIGVNHQTAPVAFRERLAFPHSGRETRIASLDLRALERDTGLGEVAVLSTCSREEVYGAISGLTRPLDGAPGKLASLLVDGTDVPLDTAGPHLYMRTGTDAIRHLCRVAAGLDSQVLGESEILGQVQQAHQWALERRLAGPVLDAAFQCAIRTGRRARVETGIAQKPVSVSSEAVRLAEEIAGPLAHKRILIVGSGKMGRLGSRVFQGKGVRHLAVISRTAAHAEAAAAECEAVALGWHRLAEAIREADIVFTSTGAPHAVITTELMQSALVGRAAGRPLLFLDIAVPRDVEPGIRNLPAVSVVDMDSINERLDANLEERRRAVPHVEHIIDTELERFEQWRHAEELRPFLRVWRSSTEAIRREELDRMLRKLGAVEPAVRDQLEQFSRSLVQRVLHEPTRRLREQTEAATSAPRRTPANGRQRPTAES